MIQTDKCRICEHQDAAPWAEENGFSTVKCRACDLIYISPWPDLSDREQSLLQGAHAGDEVIDTNSRPGGSRSIRRYRRVLDDLFGTSLADVSVKWLDIGCGYGEFLEAIRDAAGPDSTMMGNEPNTRKAAHARDRGLDVDYRELDDLPHEFSHVSLLNVFSHLPDPVDFIGKARDLLGPGGEMILQTGNAGDLDRKDVPGALWLPDHLIFAGENTLNVLFDKVGMDVVKVVKYREPRFTPMNAAKDLAKRVLRPNHNGVRWLGPSRSVWVRARTR
jgi:SAM-dependent methyltransferase